MAQSTGANVMSMLGESLRHSLTAYRVEGNREIVRVYDRTSGVEVLSVRELGPQNIAITATLGSFADLSREARDRVLERIALFNFSSQVGTLTLDETSNTIVMSHNLNPRMVPLQQMVHVASLCGDVARMEAQSLLQ
jgi:hypothetical protein